MRKFSLTILTSLILYSFIFSQDFFNIFSSGTPEEVEKAIKAGANVNERTSEGATPLWLAASKNKNPEVIDILIQAGANVNERDNNGLTPLMIAAAINQNLEVTTALIKAGANVNEHDSIDRTPLMFAASNNKNPEVIEALINSGAKVNERNSGGITPLMGAAYNTPSPEVIEFLIKGGAKVNERGSDGMTSLMLAANNNKNPEVIEALIKGGANINERNAKGDTPLMLAADSNINPGIVIELIQAGADINERDNIGNTPLMRASRFNQNPEVIEALIKSGANVNERDSIGYTPLMYAASSNQNPEVITALIKGGAKVNERFGEGFTPLMFAAYQTSNPEVITVLLKYGADRKLRDNGGHNAFIYANINENLKDTPQRLELLMNEQDFKNYYLQNINTLDPIEGIWTISIEFFKYVSNELTDSYSKQNIFKIAITKNDDKYDCHVIETDGQYPWIELRKTASFSHYLVDIKMDNESSRYNVNAVFDGNSALEFEYNFNEEDKRKNTEGIINELNLDSEQNEIAQNIIESMIPETTLKMSFKLLKIYPTIDDKKDLYTGSATCFAISNKGYFVTNYHVIANAITIMIRGINGNYNKSVKASIVSSDKNNDLAVLKISSDSVKILGSIPFCINSKLSDIGESVYVLGYPLRATMGDEIKLTNGIISSKTGFQGDISCYQISAPVQPGNSGAPIFNTKGELIGIISGKHLDAENVSYAIKSSYLLSLIDVLPEKIERKISQEPTFQGYSLTKQAGIMKRFIYIVEVF